ncbi:Receptor-like protein EIX2 [Glycine max]|nr:Receptor-like protein EIX2 [Glycine max]
MGKIPSNIDSMKNLESLDLSYNNLSGEIPAAISDLSFLSFLILSYDDLIGQIPLGIQVETLDAWSYAGNPKLYGRPLTKHFSKDVNPDEAKHGGANGSQNELLYLGIGVGYIVGLNGFWYSLILNRAWRHKYFRILDHILDWLYLFVALKLNKKTLLASARNNGGNDITSWHIYEDMCCSSLVTWILMLMSTDDAMLPELSKVTSEKIVSVSDNIAMISSTSLTTSSIHGLSSGLSWQQLRARVIAFPFIPANSF